MKKPSLARQVNLLTRENRQLKARLEALRTTEKLATDDAEQWKLRAIQYRRDAQDWQARCDKLIDAMPKKGIT